MKITLEQRCEILDIGISSAKEKPFSSWVDILRVMGKSDNEIDSMSNDEIITLGSEIIEACDKKK